MNDNSIRTIHFSSPIRYRGNLIILVLLMFLFFPIAFLLLLKNAYFLNDREAYYLRYLGHWGWVFFWGVLFFPIAFLLMIFKGFHIIHESDPSFAFES